VVTEGVAPTVVQVGEGHWFFDFGTELMAGIVLKWHAPALAGATLDLRMGEELASPQRVMEPMRTTNIYQMTWTLANGAKSSSFEQHEYFLFRYGELRYSAAGGNHDEHKPSPGNDSLPFELTAWQVHYPWSEDDSFFTSSDAGLDNIWNLCRNTLRVTSLDTTTDSNTRERRPYEVRCCGQHAVSEPFQGKPGFLAFRLTALSQARRGLPCKVMYSGHGTRQNSHC
jgi:alpha-L-rhamnosidase